jgi:hypothetical protein
VRIRARLEQGPDGGRAPVAHGTVQGQRPILVDRVRISAKVDERQNRVLLRDRVPPCRTWEAVDRVVKGLGAATIRGRDNRA